MFKKLRNKFLMLNMIMISVLLIIAFCVVFMITFNNIRTSIDMELERGIATIKPHNNQKPMNKPFQNKFILPPDFDEFVSDNNFKIEPPKMGEDFSKNGAPSPNESSSIRIDENREIVQIRSLYDYDSEFYKTVIDTAISKLDTENMKSETPRISSSIKYNEITFKYLIEKSSSGQYDNNDVKTEYYLSISNISTQINVLQRLVLNLAFVLLCALIVVFLICLFFANRSIKPIEEAWNKQNQFIEDASHELKTPLTTINTNIDALLSHENNTIAQEKKWLIYIKDESTRMAKLTNDLLYLAKVDHSSEDNIIMSEFSLSSAIENVILTTEAIAYEKKLNYIEDIESDILIKGDQSQIKQLVLILLDNAIKYTNKGGTIEISLKNIENRIAKFCVYNTGEGIPLEDRSKIFDRFYRSDKSRARNSGGYGLGLSIAKSICTSHDGTIKLDSEQGKYAKFTVEFSVSSYISHPKNLECDSI